MSMLRPLMLRGPIHCHFTSLKGELAAIAWCCVKPFSLRAGSVLTTVCVAPPACAWAAV